MPTLQDLQAQDAAYAKAGNDAQTAEQAKQTLGSTGQPNGILSWMTQMPRRITSDMIDSAVRAADSMAHDGSWGEAATRVGRDVAAGAADAVANTGDAAEELVRNGARATYESVAHPQQAALEAEDPAMLARDRMLDGSSQTSPIWQHARNAILDFRDAVAVKDPNAVDDLTQTAAQLAIPFAGYSKALSGVHDVALAALGVGKVAPEISAMQPFGDYLLATAKRDLGIAGRYVAKKAVGYATKVAAPGAMTDSTALAPHAGRLADTIALGRHVEGKFGEVLRALAPDGSLQDEYIRYLTNPDETAAEGRWKNVLDGQMAGAIATPLLEAVAPVLKQGTAGLRYLIDNGVPSMDKMPLPPQAFQEGKIVFHGTPHDFDEFDSSKIGTGEGNQTFGHGLYFAESPDVAGSYAAAVSNHKLSPEDLKAYYQPGAVRTSIGGSKDKILSYDPEKGYVTVERTDPSMPGRPQKVTFGHNSADWVNVRRALGQPLQKHGQVFKVDIPDEHIAKMIDWDQSVSAQPKLQQALRDLNVTVQPEGNRWRVMVDGKPGPQYLTRQAALSETDLLRGESPNVDAGMAYNQLAEALRGQKAASKYLASKGITGIRYLDAGSRDAKTGTRNIVLFDAKKAKILSKGEKPRA